MGQFDVHGFYDEQHDTHGFYSQDERDEAIGLGCLGIIVVAFLFVTGALMSVIDSLGHLI